MGLLDRLFGGGRHTSAPQRTASQTQPAPDPVDSEWKSTLETDDRNRRAFDLVQKAEEAANAGDSPRAEQLFLRAINACRRTDDGLNYVLGRFGSFLIDQDRMVEARSVLEQVLDLGTDIPRIASDYASLLVDAGDVEGLFRLATRRTTEGRPVLDPESLLGYARRAGRDGHLEFAETVTRRIMEEADRAGDRGTVWAAVGELGRILERADRLGEAIAVWTRAFREGSDNEVTADRLSMQLERRKDFPEACFVIRDALTRGLQANVEERLRKRLARCELKIAPSGTARKLAKTEKRDVASFSERQGAGAFRLLFQTRVKPPIRDLELIGRTARCLGVNKQVGSLVDINLDTGAEIRRVEGLPDLDDTEFWPDGWGIWLTRTGRVGNGSGELHFVNPEGRVRGQATIPDVPSELAAGDGLWFVGCRDGKLYGFDREGGRLWAWETPGSRRYNGDVYFRPCPYHVASGGTCAVVASMADLYAVNSRGKTLWHVSIPNAQETRYTFTVPLDGSDIGSRAYDMLQVPPGSDHAAVKVAYRRLAMATHPDRNPEDPAAADKFREVQTAYEAIVAGVAGSRESSREGITFSIEISGFGPTVSFLAANEQGVLAGSSHGRLYHLDWQGRIQQVRALGQGAVNGALHPDGSLAAVWCDGVLFFFKGTEVVNTMDVDLYPRGLRAIGNDVLIFRDNRVEVLDSEGRHVWIAEFAKKVVEVAWHSDLLICAAGALCAFQRFHGTD